MQLLYFSSVKIPFSNLSVLQFSGISLIPFISSKAAYQIYTSEVFFSNLFL